jgi:hypothetical protein
MVKVGKSMHTGMIAGDGLFFQASKVASRESAHESIRYFDGLDGDDFSGGLFRAMW